MTNRKIKNAQRNMMMNNILETNVWNILGTMVCLHRMGESKKKITAVLEEYRTETVPYWEQLAAAEVQNTMVRERLAKIHIEYSEVRSLISFITGNKLHSSIVDALTENLGILCLQINSSFGYGRKRLLQLFGQLRAYKSENGDAKSDAEMLFKAEYEDNQNVLPDIDSLRYRKLKVDLEEAKEQKRNLEALRLFQEKNCKSSDTAGIS